jgi:hypothetical protein
MVCGGIFVMFFMRAYFFASVPRLWDALRRRAVDEPPTEVGGDFADQRRAA